MAATASAASAATSASSFTHEMSGRRVLVTGAGSGIGLATAQLLVQAGAQVAAVVQNLAQQQIVQPLLGSATVLVQDLLDDAACAALPERAAQALGGPLQGLALCAGVFYKKSSDDTALDEWRHTLDLNLTATFVLARAGIAHMRQASVSGASVVVVSSQIGRVGHARGAAYAASKAALNGMVRSLALEWATAGIRINAVGPGPIDTPMVAAAKADPAAIHRILSGIPMGRLGEAHEIAEVMSFLLSPRASFLTGQLLCVDGGFTAQ